jgi:microcystin degradation protein MlrC
MSTGKSGGPRIALLGIHLESNAFAPPTTAEDFRSLCYLEGVAILAEAAKPSPAMPAEMAAFIRAWVQRGAWTPVPILLAAAEPGGPVEHEALEAMLAAIRRRLSDALPVDAVYLSNHGAMTSTQELDADGLLYRLVRELVGPAVPMVATVDLHANLSDDMVALADLIVAYRTNPHVDQEARGAEAAQLIAALLGGARFPKAFIRLPLVPPTVSLLTASGPYADIINDGQARARQQPEIVNVSVTAGFAFADTPKNGFCVLVTARSQAAADRLAGELANRAWRERQRFAVRLTPLEMAVLMAREAADDPAQPPLLLADVADNPGGGGRGNTTFLLEALQTGGVTGVLLGNFVDPKLAEEAHYRKVGKRFNATFNRGGHIGFTRRYVAEATVVALSDGKCVGTRGIWAGRALDVGPTAALDLGGITVVVTSLRKQCADPVFFEMLGLDVAAARVVVVKSRGHFRAGFAPLFPPERIIEVDAPGLTSPVLSRFKFQHLPRPVYPLDPQAIWPAR